MSAPTKAEILSWRKSASAGWKRAAKHFGLSVAEVKTICHHAPKSRASTPARACKACKALRAELEELKRGTEAAQRVKGARMEFLEGQLISALADLEALRSQRHSGTAVSVQTRTVVEIREQLDAERIRIAELDGNPLEAMGADELVADISEVLRDLPDMLHDRIAEVMLERYGLAPEVLLG